MEDIENLADSLSTAQEETKAVLSDVMRLPERFRVPIVLYYFIWAFRPQRLPSYCMCQPRPFETRLARGRIEAQIHP